jgi:hypothetical protein
MSRLKPRPTKQLPNAALKGSATKTKGDKEIPRASAEGERPRDDSSTKSPRAPRLLLLWRALSRRSRGALGYNLPP